MTQKEILEYAKDMVSFVIEKIDEELTEEFLNHCLPEQNSQEEQYENDIRIKNLFWKFLSKESKKLGK